MENKIARAHTGFFVEGDGKTGKYETVWYLAVGRGQERVAGGRDAGNKDIHQ